VKKSFDKHRNFFLKLLMQLEKIVEKKRLFLVYGGGGTVAP
jgi:hypothetical protein